MRLTTGTRHDTILYEACSRLTAGYRHGAITAIVSGGGTREMAMPIHGAYGQ